MAVLWSGGLLAAASSSEVIDDAPVVLPDDLPHGDRGQLEQELLRERENYADALSKLMEQKTEYNSFQLDDDTLDAYEELFRKSRVQSLRRQAYLAQRFKDWVLAEDLYIQVLNLRLNDEERRDVIMEMANMLETAGHRMKHVAVLEKFTSTFPGDPELPTIFLRLGRTYREVGAHNLALARFYSVLNTSLSLDPDQIIEYKRLSVNAQFEIARTHFSLGDYDEAAKFFDRLKLLDLPVEERAEAHFQAAYARYLLEQYPSVLASLDRFIEQYPDSPDVPESRYLLATTHRELGRPEKALAETLGLLRDEAASDPEALRFWQRKTGNQLANEFYEAGDYLSALRVYQAMVPLSSDPAWQWPVIYQIGLTFERLGMNPRAIDAYRILTGADDWERTEIEVSENLQSLQEMAQWRLEHLEWANGARRELSTIGGSSTSTNLDLAHESGTRP